MSLYRLFGKRILDICFVLVTAPVSLMMVVCVAALTALDGYNPFYRQKRIGRNGKEFWLLKIRTMVPNADTMLEAHLQQNPVARQQWAIKQKLEPDFRVTKIGAMLRKSSLDELPQLWNVLLGDMSLVGPRPMMVEQQRMYPGRSYFYLRPGITGNWQVSDRNDCSFPSRAKFDEAYHSALGLWTDLKLLGRTIVVVLRCTGR
ncbi:MAG: sugar transferase [Pseudomonadota bacterium]